MGMIIYGTRVFSKHEGYYGPKEECPICHKIYSKGYVRYTSWFHLDYIPLFPYKKVYFKMCPICGNGMELKKKDAKQEMDQFGSNPAQNFEIYANHVLAKKPKGLMATDNSYEVWIKDLVTGEEMCLVHDTIKDTIKDIKKERAVKKIEIRNV